jgi:hypothetical protein
VQECRRRSEQCLAAALEMHEVDSLGDLDVARIGQVLSSQGADKAMQVSSSGTVDLHALVMFVVDAQRPFSSPAAMP